MCENKAELSEYHYFFSLKEFEMVVTTTEIEERMYGHKWTLEIKIKKIREREREKKLVSVCLEPLTGLFLGVAERNAHPTLSIMGSGLRLMGRVPGPTVVGKKSKTLFLLLLLFFFFEQKIMSYKNQIQ